MAREQGGAVLVFPNGPSQTSPERSLVFRPTQRTLSREQQYTGLGPVTHGPGVGRNIGLLHSIWPDLFFFFQSAFNIFSRYSVFEKLHCVLRF